MRVRIVVFFVFFDDNTWVQCSIFAYLNQMEMAPVLPCSPLWMPYQPWWLYCGSLRAPELSHIRTFLQQEQPRPAPWWMDGKNGPSPQLPAHFRYCAENPYLQQKRNEIHVYTRVEPIINTYYASQTLLSVKITHCTSCCVFCVHDWCTKSLDYSYGYSYA